MVTQFRTSQMSDDDLIMREYVFTFIPQQMSLRFITYRKNARAHENAPWFESDIWRFSIDEPEPPHAPPAWAVEEIKRQIINRINLE